MDVKRNPGLPKRYADGIITDPVKKGRFNVVDDAAVAQIQNSRTAPKTNEATDWGVRALKSKQYEEKGA